MASHVLHFGTLAAECRGTGGANPETMHRMTEHFASIHFAQLFHSYRCTLNSSSRASCHRGTSTDLTCVHVPGVHLSCPELGAGLTCCRGSLLNLSRSRLSWAGLGCSSNVSSSNLNDLLGPGLLIMGLFSRKGKERASDLPPQEECESFKIVPRESDGSNAAAPQRVFAMPWHDFMQDQRARGAEVDPAGPSSSVEADEIEPVIANLQSRWRSQAWLRRERYSRLEGSAGACSPETMAACEAATEVRQVLFRHDARRVGLGRMRR